jgi:diketogulonate reductase-like aldo/keto reductase
MSPESPKLPRLIYGTAFKDEAQTKALVKHAFTLGYRGIDTANVRNNYKEAEAGDAVREVISSNVVSRKDIYVCVYSHV